MKNKKKKNTDTFYHRIDISDQYKHMRKYIHPSIIDYIVIAHWKFEFDE